MAQMSKRCQARRTPRRSRPPAHWRFSAAPRGCVVVRSPAAAELSVWRRRAHGRQTSAVDFWCRGRHPARRRRTHLCADARQSGVRFFDCRTSDTLPAAAVVARPVLFRLWVMGSAHSTGRWSKLAAAPVSPALQKPVRRYNQDPLRPQDIRLTFDGCDGPLVSVADCEGLECAAVWDAEHVEDRLRSHYSGAPCEWTLSLRPKVVAPNHSLHLTA